jgi:hypothetical protein
MSNVKYVFVIIFCFLQNCIFPQTFDTLLEKFEYGMDINKIREIYPNANSYSSSENGIAIFAFLAIDEIVISDEKFEVVFLLDDKKEKLEYIQIQQQEKYGHSNRKEEDQIIFDNIIKYFTNNYGEPVSRKSGFPSTQRKSVFFICGDKLISCFLIIDDPNFQYYDPQILIAISKDNVK